MSPFRAFLAVACGAAAWLGAPAARASEFENAIVYPVDDTPVPPVPGAEVVVPPEPIRPRRHFDDDPFNVELRFGYATSVGVVGIVGEVNVTDRLALGAGYGSNLYGSDIDVHARFRPVVGASKNGRTLYALTMESSFTDSAYDGASLNDVFCGLSDSESEQCHDVATQRVFWGQLELGWEMRLASGMSLRVATGGATLLGNYRWHCSDEGAPISCNDRDLPVRTVFSQTFAWGLAF